MEKATEFQENIYFCFIDYAKAFDWVDHSKLENCERDGMDLTEAEDIKKRWQQYTEELYKKDLHEKKKNLVTHITTMI